MDPMLEISRVIQWLAPVQRDPRPALLAPGAGARHTAEHFEVASSMGAIPTVWLRPLRATGATVIYAHGGGTADILPSAPLFEALLRRGVGVVAFAFPGFGAHPADLTFPACLECLPAVISTVQSRAEGGPIALYGLSLGAILGLHAARQEPGLRALALFGPPLDLYVTDDRRWRELLGTFHPFAAPVLLDAPSGHLARLFFEPIRFGPHSHHLIFDKAFATQAGKILEALAPLVAAAQTPKMPVLIIGGEWDAAAPPEDLGVLADAFTAPPTLKIFPHRTHTTLLYDRAVAEFTADWLSLQLS
jgi:alpha-beta hydrolase superfamily lysophospholipase